MRRYLPLLAALALAAPGCGGRDDGEIRDALTGYLDAVADRDGSRACGYLTENAQLGIFEFKLVHIAPHHPAAACAAIVERRAPSLAANSLRDVQIEQIEVDGDHATTQVGGHEAQLVKVDDEWKIDVFGLASDVADTASS
jgi:hypothetical protein